MIQANELRIGNAVQYEGLGHSRITTVFDRYATIGILGGRALELEKLIPIPLTSVVLEACGFVKNGFNEFCLSINPFDQGIKELCLGCDYLWLRESANNTQSHKDDIVTLWNKDLMKEFYLHQLQNIYYALTGKELTIKLPA